MLDEMDKRLSGRETDYGTGSQARRIPWPTMGSEQELPCDMCLKIVRQSQCDVTVIS